MTEPPGTAATWTRHVHVELMVCWWLWVPFWLGLEGTYVCLLVGDRRGLPRVPYPTMPVDWANPCGAGVSVPPGTCEPRWFPAGVRESLSSAWEQTWSASGNLLGPQQSFHIREMGMGHSSAWRTWELSATVCGSSAAHVAAFVPSTTLCLLLTFRVLSCPRTCCFPV